MRTAEVQALAAELCARVFVLACFAALCADIGSEVIRPTFAAWLLWCVTDASLLAYLAYKRDPAQSMAEARVFVTASVSIVATVGLWRAGFVSV